MRPTDHVQMVMSWCELMLRCVDRVGISEMAWEDCLTLTIFLYTGSDHIHKRPWAQRQQLVTDWLYSYLLSTLGSATLFGFLRFRQTVADCCKVWQFSRYISLPIWTHRALLSLVSVAPRLYVCGYTYLIQGEYEVASSPASEHSPTVIHTRFMILP